MKFEKLSKFALKDNQIEKFVGGAKGGSQTATVCQDYSYNNDGGHCDTNTETTDDEGNVISTRTTGSC